MNATAQSSSTRTELFVSDVHGEYEAFSQALRNACGKTRATIDALFPSHPEAERAALLSLVCYPEEKLALDAGLTAELPSLVELAAHYASGKTLEEVQAGLPEGFASLAETLVAGLGEEAASTAAELAAQATAEDSAEGLTVALAKLIQRLSVDHLYLVGDIYDRGPAPDLIMDELMNFHSVSIQWGNHDIVWMGASLGQRGCIAHVVRNCARYGNLSILEDAYGMDLGFLRRFAAEAYADDPCVAFGLKVKTELDPAELEANIKIQKAMAILQFKVEAVHIDENPSYHLEDRKLLDKIDFDANTIVVDDITYPLADTVFPTVDAADPYRLTIAEEEVMTKLQEAFIGCEKLQRHMRFFLEAGGLYQQLDDMLLFHACVPLNADGSLLEADVYGELCKGKHLYEVVDAHVKNAFFSDDPMAKKRGLDLMWWLWLSPASPLFAKSKMATFELYLIADKAARKEVKNPFYTLRDQEGGLNAIFEDFGLDPETAHIVCGHVPVKVKDGEDPIKCEGLVVCVDGGWSKAYQPTTGVAGFTLIRDERGLTLATHESFAGREAAITQNADLHSTYRPVR